MTTKATAKICVKDVMSRNPVCVNQSTSAQELAEILESNDISGVPVLDPREKLVGVVSRSDLLHRCVEGPVGAARSSFFSTIADGMTTESGLDPEALGVVEDFMSIKPVTATVDERVDVVAHRMAEENVHRVVVLDTYERVIGMVTTLDLLQVFPNA